MTSSTTPILLRIGRDHGDEDAALARAAGAEWVAAADVAAGLAAARARRPDVVLVDGGDAATIAALRREPALAEVPLVAIVRADGDEEWADAADAALARPIAPAALRSTLRLLRARVGEDQRVLFDQIDAGFCVVDMIFDAEGRPADYRIVDYNAAYERFTGLAGSRGRLATEAAPGLERHWFELYGEVARTGEPAHVVQHASVLHDRWFDVRACRLGGPGSVRVAILFADISARRRAEATLTETARQRDALLDLQRAVAAAAAGGAGEAAVLEAAAARALAVVPLAGGAAIELLERDAAGVEVLAYRAAAGTMAGALGTSVRRDASLSGTCLNEGRPLVCDDSETDPRVDLAVCRRIGIRSMVVVPIPRGGALVGVLKLASAAPGAFAEPDVLAAQLAVGAIATGLSGAAEARAIEAMRESEARFRTIADAMPQIVWVTRPDGHHEYFNRRWYDYVGAAPGETDGDRWATALHEEDRPRARERWRRSLESGEPYEIEYRLRGRDGAFRWFLGLALPARRADGAITHWYGTCTDIDDQRRLRDERDRLLASERAARAEAERAGRMKDEFLATLSHELRTPLSAMLGWSQVLQRSTKLDDLHAGLATIERNARAQSQIIEDLLDMSRIIGGKIRLDVQPTDVAAIVRAAVETIRPAADARQIELWLALGDGPAPISGDPARLGQVLWNLLANAVKFTPRGGRVGVVLARADGHVAVRVEDTGEGIAPALLPFVFDRFRQADSSSTRRHGGLGLGLSICRQLVELHGGTIRAESAGAGRGSSFVVKLPAHGPRAAVDDRRPARVAVERAAIDDAIDLAGLRVLVVDDEPDAADLARRVLSDRGATVAVARSAAEALDRLAEAAFDLIVSDIGMPDVDGHALIRRVRALPADRGGQLPAIALTAYAAGEDRARALAAGFQIHVSKPVDRDALIAAAVAATRGDS